MQFSVLKIFNFYPIFLNKNKNCLSFYIFLYSNEILFYQKHDRENNFNEITINIFHILYASRLIKNLKYLNFKINLEFKVYTEKQ